MLKLCNLEPAFSTTILVPDFDREEMFAKCDHYIDKRLFYLSEAEKSEAYVKEAAKGLEWFGTKSKEKYKQLLDSIPDLGCSKSRSTLPPHPTVAQKRKTVVSKKNLKLAETKQQAMGKNAPVIVENQASSGAPLASTAVNREPSSTEQETAMNVQPKTLTGVPKSRRKTQLPMSQQNKNDVQKKVVKFAKGTKGEDATDTVGFGWEATQHATTVAAGVPSSESKLPTEDGKMPTPPTTVPTEMSFRSEVTTKPPNVVQKVFVASSDPKVPTPATSQPKPPTGVDQSAKSPSSSASTLPGGDLPVAIATQQPNKPVAPAPYLQSTLTQEEVFSILSKCLPPRPPTSILLQTKSANDAAANVSQAGASGH